MNVKPYDLSAAVSYHAGQFPPTALNYEALLGPLEEAAASLARYDAKMAGMVNSELFLAPLRRQDAVTSSRMEGTISTIEELYRLEAEEDAGGADTSTGRRATTMSKPISTPARSGAPSKRSPKGAPWANTSFGPRDQQLLSFGRGARKRPGGYKTSRTTSATIDEAKSTTRRSPRASCSRDGRAGRL